MQILHNGHMSNDSRMSVAIWKSWLEPLQAIRLLLDAGLDNRQQAVNWLKARLREGALRAAGWHVIWDDDFSAAGHKVASFKVSTWSKIDLIDWQHDFWVSGNYEPSDGYFHDLWEQAIASKLRSPTEFEHGLNRVRFDSGAITEFCGRMAPAVVPAIKAPNAAGRPPKPFWEQLWAFIAASLYLGDLKPQRQADIENAMSEWLVANGHEAGESTVRRASRALWQAIIREEKSNFSPPD